MVLITARDCKVLALLIPKLTNRNHILIRHHPLCYFLRPLLFFSLYLQLLPLPSFNCWNSHLPPPPFTIISALGRINHVADGAVPQGPAPQGAPRLWGERGKERKKKKEKREKRKKERKRKK